MIDKKKKGVLLTLLAVSICFSGCSRPTSAVVPKIPYDDPQQLMPSKEALYASLPPSEGSLWTDTGNMLFVDQKARRAGDTVIVDIVENSSSSMDANTSTSKDSTIDANVSDLMGYMTWLKLKNPNLDPDKLISTGYKNEFDGKGTSDRSGQITASIGAIVTGVLPNGNIIIYGRREMKVNNESQYITVSGIVRPKDIDADNRVKSTYLADARIEYSGKGVIADKQKVGWLSRILDNVWPF
ncbi:MAG: flagellar basal body L-ring protein FlgH [Proteobacteria bacterium]|nr:flagellar basal body L-ring protein FlgH [Pseudomonadota bacterium]